MTKLMIDPETERILGVGIVGAGAGELISEGVLAVEMGATAKRSGAVCASASDTFRNLNGGGGSLLRPRHAYVHPEKGLTHAS